MKHRFNMGFVISILVVIISIGYVGAETGRSEEHTSELQSH